MVGDSLVDLTDDTLLLILDNLLVNKPALIALQRTCSFFTSLFNTYSIWKKHEKAVENAWMGLKPVKSKEVVIASTISEKESQLNNSEHMEVLFMDVCDKYIVLVRYNQLDIVCSCLSMECQCRVDEKDSFEQMNAVPKRLEIWDKNFRIVRVISSKNFGLNSSKTLGGAEEFTFWSSMKREYPLFSYNKQRKIFAWVGSQIQDIQVDFHFIEENSSKCMKIGNKKECFRAYAVAMLGDKFAIAFEKKFTSIRFELLIRWYQYDTLDQFYEMQIFESETNIGKYSFNNCSPLDINEAFTVIVNEVQVLGVDDETVFKMSSVTHQKSMITRNIQFYRNHSRIFMKMNENTNLIALLDSSVDFGEHSIVRLFKAQDLEEVLTLNLRNHNIDKTALTESSNRVFWFKNILVVVSDEDIEDENDFVSGRRLAFFTINHDEGQVVSRNREVDFWNGFVSKQTSTDPKLPLLGCGKDKGLFLEAVAVGEMGIVMAARLNCEYNYDFEDPDEMSYLFYMSMLPM